MNLSVVIITKNEEIMLPGCLKTLTFADEILVIDTGSTDRTVRLAKKEGAHVVEYLSGKNFSDWRNKGLKHAKGDWILYIDADERVPQKLQDEILSIIQSPMENTWYAIPRSNIIFGQEFRHGGFWPDYVKRLFNKRSLKAWEKDLHEEPVVEGSMGKLKNYLRHDKHETISEMVEKTNKWSDIEGKLMFEANHPPMNIIRFGTAMLREFWQRMVIGLAFLDGPKGIIMAIYQVYSRFCSYAKLWELQVKNNKIK